MCAAFGVAHYFYTPFQVRQALSAEVVHFCGLSAYVAFRPLVVRQFVYFR